ncbi:MAG: C39 family peptidase [Oscillospiraceae bacterium]|nr:C39 family peptidase [Oscillospiraceae bacterium]
MKVFKSAIILLCVVFSICFVATAVMIIKQSVYDMLINDNVESLVRNIKYTDSQQVNGVPVTQLKITCGYASIEMVAKYLGYDSITEQSIYDSNDKKISTSTNSGFYKEITKQFPDYQITQYTNLKNTEMIDKIYNSLAHNMPVVICFAAENKNLDVSEQKWALHYSVITGIDVINDKVTVNDAYGYTDEYSFDDFLKATRFESYDNMNFYLKLGFAFGLFNKNTIYIIEKPEDTKDIP